MPAERRRATGKQPIPEVAARSRVSEQRTAIICAFIAWLSLSGAARAQIPTWMTRWSLGTRETGQVLNLGPLPAVTRIIVPEKDGVSYGSGTLVAVREQNGLVITNWHVVRDASGPISVLFPDAFQSPAQVLKVDQDWDLAALAIWKPNVAPMPVALQPPQPGEELAIAGYGSGQWRASMGKCTQYVSPGAQHPLEMVELAATARQGDSGGPIVNARGELAGVLFGSGHGATSGSYCGRVRQFLTSLAPEMAVDQAAPSPQALVAAAPVPLPGWPSPKSPPSNSIPLTALPPAEKPAERPPPKADPYGPPVAPEPEIATAESGDARPAPAPRGPLAIPGKPTVESTFSSLEVAPRRESPLAEFPVKPRELEPVVARDAVETDAGYTYTPLPPRGGRSLATPLDQAHPQDLLKALWASLVGSSHFEQGKSALAFLGVAVILLRVFRSRRSSSGDEEVDD